MKPPRRRLSVRDLFALEVLPAIIASRTALLLAGRMDPEGPLQSVAEQAYVIADDMMAIRERQSGRAQL